MLGKTFITALLASSALAAPTPREEEVMSMATGEEWTLETLKRVCNEDYDKCTWSFGINTNEGANATACTYVVEGEPANETPGGPVECGKFTITSGWDPNGFTVLSVIDYEIEQLIYAGYNETLVKGGKVVKPDRSWPVEDLP